jgi:hypothetical protein
VPSGLERNTWSMLNPRPPLSVSPRRNPPPLLRRRAVHQASAVFAHVYGDQINFEKLKMSGVRKILH